MQPQPVAGAPPPASGAVPANLGLLKVALGRYQASGAYGRDLAAVDAAAARWVIAQAPQVAHPALVLDIDETSLSNWAEFRANDYGFIPGGACQRLPLGPCGFLAWVRAARAPALAPTLHLAQAARAAHVAIFFVTGRDEPLRAATAANLRRAGYAGWTDLILEPARHRPYRSAADFKAPARAAIERRGYTIVANVGDQESDLAGGHAMRGFKLPNPFYFLP